MSPWWWFLCKPKHVEAASIILMCFNNSTFFTLCALVGIIKCSDSWFAFVKFYIHLSIIDFSEKWWIQPHWDYTHFARSWRPSTTDTRSSTAVWLPTNLQVRHQNSKPRPIATTHLRGGDSSHDAHGHLHPRTDVSPARFTGHRVSTISTKTGGHLGITSTDGLNANIKFQHNAAVAFRIVITITISLNMFVVFPVSSNAMFISCGTDTFDIDAPRIRFSVPLPVRRNTTAICNFNANVTYGLNNSFDGPSYTVRTRDTAYRRSVLRWW